MASGHVQEMAKPVKVSSGEVAARNECRISSRPPIQKGRYHQRVKLVFLIRNLGIGGAERQLVALATNLDRNKFDVTVLTLYGGGEFLEDLTRGGVRAVSLNKKGRWDLLSITWHLIRVIRELKPDILHSYLTGQNLLAIMAKMALPGTRIVWGVRNANFNDRHRDWLSSLTCRTEIRLSRFPDLIISNSLAGQNYHLAAGFAGKRMVVIPNGIDTDRFAPDRRAGLRCRASWGVPSSSLVIGVVGHLARIKDHGTFLKAAAIFSRSRADTRFVCIGSGPDNYLRELRQLGAVLGLNGKVLWLGSVAEMPAAYNALDIYCSSSFGEGLSNAISEAMACGIPCVVTDVGDSAMVVGDTGVVVRRRNPEMLAAGWAKLADRIAQDPALGGAARRRIESRLSMSALISKTSEELLALL